MTILRGGYIPQGENIPVEIEVAYGIVSTLQERGMLEVRKVELGGNPYYVWELKTKEYGEI